MLQTQDMALCSLTVAEKGLSQTDLWMCFGLMEWIINWHIKLGGVFKWINTVDWRELWMLLPRGRTGNSLWKWWHVPGRTQEHCLQGLLLPLRSGKVYHSIPHSVSLLCAGGAAGDLFRLEAFDQEKVHLKRGLWTGGLAEKGEANHKTNLHGGVEERDSLENEIINTLRRNAIKTESANGRTHS